MRQALHIFRKDSRQFRIPIVIMLAWTGLFAATVAQPWPEVMFPLPEEYRRTMVARYVHQLAYFFFPAAWCFLIAQVLHAESLVGERQFWLTRPYHRGSLAAAKALFVLAYITLPLAAAQAAIVIRSGLPLTRYFSGLLWEQMLVALLILLPAAALAALTSRLSQFVLVALAAPVLVGFGGGLPNWGGLDWIRATVFAASVSALALTVLVLQFRRRRAPRSRLVGLAGTLALLIVLPLLSWPAAFAVQARVHRAWDGPVTVEAVRGRTLGAWTGVARGLQLDFHLRGLPEGSAVMCHADELTIRTPAGATHHRGIRPTSARAREDLTCPVGLPLPSSFLEPIADSPATLEAVLYVTVLGPERTVAVPVGGDPVAMPGGAVCAATADYRQTEKGPQSFTGVECRTAFQESTTLVTTVQGRALAGLTQSLWPATLRLVPLRDDSDAMPGALEAVALTIRELIAHVRIPVTAESIRLRDFEFHP
jgi:hypothetical protein